MKATRLVAAAVATFMACSCGNAKTSSGQEPATEAEGVTTMEIGSIRLITIRDDDGERRMPNKLFYGKADSAKVERLSPEGSVPSSVSCFLVEAKGKKVLFDTGNGAGRGGMLLKRLKDIGVKPGDIDYIMITHFHGDHIGGMTNNGKPVFTKAEVYVCPTRSIPPGRAWTTPVARRPWRPWRRMATSCDAINMPTPCPLA